MIRACLALTFALVAAWTSSSLVFIPADDRPADREVISAPALPEAAVTAPTPVRPDVPGPHPSDDAALFHGPPLVLDGSRIPLPRPSEVVTMRPHPRPPSAQQILTGARIPAPPASLQNASDLTCIAVAIYHEARDQTDLGQRAVASVILQRAAVPHRWGRTACDSVVPTQFSFMTSRYAYPPIEDMVSWQKAVQFAAEVFLQGPMQELRGADHYHTTEVSPAWAPRMERVTVIDDHIFYADPRS
ncbi:hypothetical protein FA743_15630 [Paracoccus gahaiensis]|uniref:Cell wall hydrolase SleB domain-containing protein n=1 Tax=Paracoccus gahaiensis TaxID=1706839 RepID=A0A4U0R5U9_9RHOB|nr:cell wall hydrolase [Paracoccus gahaiensis]TJZ90351.1 hypothetical protein FA743_15630 [Paracoccus gahaiensis]